MTSQTYRCGSTHRAKHYERTVRRNDGTTDVSLAPFTHAQAAEIGAVLETDGINIVSAQRLCEQWTRRGQNGDVSYSYRVPFTRSAA